MKRKVLVCASLAILGASAVKAQLNVGSNTAPVAGAMLQVSGTAAGFLPPVMTTTNRNAIPTPPTGLIIFNSTTNQVEVNTGTTVAPIWTAATSTTADLRFLGSSNHVSVDAGVGGNGTSLGTGTGNIAIGNQASGANTTGTYNTAIGQSALRVNTTGGTNVALGINTLYNNVGGNSNVGVGYQSLLTNISGSNNVGLGLGALQNATGSNNTVVGTNAGSNLTSGTNNIAIGNSTNLASVTGNDQMNIGNIIFGTGLSGSVGAPAGNIGIGTSTPNAALQFGNILTSRKIVLYDGQPAPGDANQFYGYGITAGQLRYQVDATTSAHVFYAAASSTTSNELMRIQGNGNVGIGTSAPISKLTVNGAATNLAATNASASNTIDFSLSNLAYTSGSATAFTLNNLRDGGTYTLAVKGTTSATASFTASGFTVHPPVDNGATIANKQSVYTFVVMGTDVYTYWVTGF